MKRGKRYLEAEKLIEKGKLYEAKEALEALQKQVYVATADIESGAEVSLEDFSMGTVQTKMDASLMISADDFEFTNEDGEIDPKYDEDGNAKNGEYAEIFEEMTEIKASMLRSEQALRNESAQKND